MKNHISWLCSEGLTSLHFALKHAALISSKANQRNNEVCLFVSQ